MREFSECYDMDIRKYVKKRTDYTGTELTYLPWYNALILLYKKLDVKRVRYYPSEITDKYIKLFVVIDEDSFTITYPASGNLEYAIQRAFVKAVAINTGLGLSLWNVEQEEREVNLNQEITLKLAQLVKASGNLDDALSVIGTNRDELKKLLSSKDDSDKVILLGLIIAATKNDKQN